MDLRVLIGVVWACAILCQAQRQMPPIMSNPNPGAGMPPGVRMPQNPNAGIGISSGVRMPQNQGSGPRPGIRTPSQGSGLPLGTRVNNQMPMIPGNNRNVGRPAQRPGSDPSRTSSGQCTAAGMSVIQKCFQENGGIRMQNVYALVSGSSMAPGSRSRAQITSAICRNQGSIISCIYDGIIGLRGSQVCSSTQEYSQLEHETVSLVSAIQNLCGKGPLATPDTCFNDIDKNMRQCYQKYEINPDLFSVNGTTVLQSSGPSELIAAIIGTDAKKAKLFCRNKSQLFSCLKQTITKCPAGRTLMERSGYDHEILTAGIDVLCHNVNEYLRSLKCFKETSSETKRCQSTIATKLRELEDGGRRQQMSTYQYETAKCQLKVQLMECDIGVWKNKCSDSVAGLKNEFECNVLPSSCKNNRNLQNSLQQTCAIQKFARQLRSGSSKRFSLTSVMMTILSASIVLLVL